MTEVVEIAALGDGLVASITLICAVLASLGVGVLLAHGICVGMFAVFRMHARQVAATRLAEPAARLEAMRG